MMDCLNSMVGVIDTSTACPCITNGLTEEDKAKLSQSTSGLYLENLEGSYQMKNLRAGNECGAFKELAFKAIGRAVKIVKEDLVKAITVKYDKAKEPYTGALGYQSYSRPYTPTTDMVGMRIAPSSTNRDSQITINGISIATFSAITTTVYLYKSLPGASMGTLVQQWPVTTTPQGLASVSGFQPLKLSMSENGQPLEYYFVYDRMGAMPMDIQPTCNCPGVNAAIGQYVNVTGIDLASTNSLPGIQQQFTGGLSVNVVLQCRMENLICKGAYDEEDAVSIAIANMVLYKAGEMLIEYVQGSNVLNRDFMVRKEYYWGKRNHFAARYNQISEYIGDVIDISSSDCFICKSVQENTPTVMLIGG